MRGDIKDSIDFLAKEDFEMYNKSELARRFNCDPRTIDRYIKSIMENGYQNPAAEYINPNSMDLRT